MKLPKHILSMVLSCAVYTVTTIPQQAFAQDHVVPLSELHEKTRAASETRSKNISDIQRVLSLPAAAKELAKSNVNQQQVQQAVATLTDAELTRLAEQARTSEKDVQGGFIVGILALIGLIVVIVIVVSVVAENRTPHLETAV